MIVYKILGITSNKATEFIKANIKIKTIRVEKNGNVKEHMPLPNFKFKDIVVQDWEESSLYKILNETKYLMVFYYKEGDEYYLKSACFWNMPYSDLNNIVKAEWTKVKETIIKGVEFTINGNRVSNNLLGASESKVIHVRPHTQKAAYRLHNGFEKGDVSYCDELPNGELITKQSFWINKSYLIEQFKLK